MRVWSIKAHNQGSAVPTSADKGFCLLLPGSGNAGALKKIANRVGTAPVLGEI